LKFLSYPLPEEQQAFCPDVAVTAFFLWLKDPTLKCTYTPGIYLRKISERSQKDL
jgi:hypothetical protein